MMKKNVFVLVLLVVLLISSYFYYFQDHADLMLEDVDIANNNPTQGKVKAYPYSCDNGRHISVSEIEDYLYVYIDNYAESFVYLPDPQGNENLYVYDNAPVFSSLEFAGEGTYELVFLDEETLCLFDEEEKTE